MLERIKVFLKGYSRVGAGGLLGLLIAFKVLGWSLKFFLIYYVFGKSKKPVVPVEPAPVEAAK